MTEPLRESVVVYNIYDGIENVLHDVIESSHKGEAAAAEIEKFGLKLLEFYTSKGAS